MRRGSLVVLLAASLGVGATSLAFAQQKGAKGIVAVRQATMDANGGHMSVIKFILTETPELTKQDRLPRPGHRRGGGVHAGAVSRGQHPGSDRRPAGDLGEAGRVQAGCRAGP